MSAPIGREFSRIFEEQTSASPWKKAWKAWDGRVPNVDLRFFVTAVILQRQTGGDLAEILDKIGSLIRDRFKIWGQIQALTGEGRLSGVILLALPLSVLTCTNSIRSTSTCCFRSAGEENARLAAVMQLVGALVIPKIINIKV